MKRSAQTPEGPAELVELFTGHQIVSGLRLPFETSQTVNGEVKASTKLSAIKVNTGVSGDFFKKPETLPAP